MPFLIRLVTFIGLATLTIAYGVFLTGIVALISMFGVARGFSEFVSLGAGFIVATILGVAMLAAVTWD